jgi:hypothetical protein
MSSRLLYKTITHKTPNSKYTKSKPNPCIIKWLLYNEFKGLAGGCCFDFNAHSEHLLVLGTEEGKIHKCSKAYSGQYLETYEGLYHLISDTDI